MTRTGIGTRKCFEWKKTDMRTAAGCQRSIPSLILPALPFAHFGAVSQTAEWGRKEGMLTGDGGLNIAMIIVINKNIPLIL